MGLYSLLHWQSVFVYDVKFLYASVPGLVRGDPMVSTPEILCIKTVSTGCTGCKMVVLSHETAV